MRLFPSLESALEFSSNLPRNWPPRRASLFPLTSRGEIPPNRYATFRSKTLHLHWTVFRARSVRLIDLEPCLKFTWVMSMKLERILIARLECSSSSLFLHGRHGKITRIVIRLCEYCKISYRELLFTIGRKRRIELI